MVVLKTMQHFLDNGCKITSLVAPPTFSAESSE
jgi:hypothetical protein